jgi:hypothetical protein
MGIRGALRRMNKENSIRWSDTKKDDKIQNSGWSEDATTPSGTDLYRLYYDNDKKGVYLLDIQNEVTYEVPLGAKAKGYTLASKLFSRYVKS